MRSASPAQTRSASLTPCGSYRPTRYSVAELEAQLAKKEAVIAKKEAVIAEISEEYVKVKKSFGEP
jgi:hypothetical protein